VPKGERRLQSLLCCNRLFSEVGEGLHTTTTTLYNNNTPPSRKMPSLPWLFLVLLLVLLCITSGFGEVAKGFSMEIEGRLVIPDGSSSANIKVVLNGEQYTTLSRTDGVFIFHQVPSGIYSLEVLTPRVAFPSMKIKVTFDEEQQQGSVSVVEYKYPGAKRIPASYPIELTAIVPISYFMIRPPFSLLGLIMGNPMIILMCGFVALMAYFPKMLAGMDPEVLEEMQKQQGGAEDPMKVPFAQLFNLSTFSN